MGLPDDAGLDAIRSLPPPPRDIVTLAFLVYPGMG